MNPRILFSDFDGTLYINATISDADREALRRWRAAGNLFALASGRHVSALKEHLAQEGIEWDYLLCLNGAEAYDRDGQLLFETPIAISLLPELYRTMVQEDGCAKVCYGSRADRIRTEHCSDLNPEHTHYSESHLDSFEKFTQICTAMQTESEAPAVKKRVLERFGDFVCAELNGRCIDVNARGVSKSSGIAKLIERIGLDKACVYTIGDNFNDLCMLTDYNGYAVAHAPEAVRTQTGRTVKSIAELIDQVMTVSPSIHYYQKLVRDRIPEMIRHQGFTPITRRLNADEYLSELHRKLREETEEYLSDQSAEEIADILEVIEAICAAKGFSREEISRVKSEKYAKRGGFDKRIYLISKEG